MLGHLELTFHVFSVQKGVAVKNQFKARIVVISGSSDSALQYMTFMNVFFSAQKEVNFIFNHL
jgi:Transcription factor Tfb4